MIDSITRSLLAIDLTTYGLAFVAFERGDLLDWGHRYFRSENANPLEIVDHLVDGTAAEVLVMEAPDGPGCRRGERIRDLIARITSHVRKRRIAVILIDRREVRRAWATRGLTTKESTAAAIAAELPELAPYVPPKRKISRTEDERVNLFDAVSLALYASRTPDTR